MTTRIIQKVFVYQPLTPGLVPVTTSTWSDLPLQQGAIGWSSFMNTYAGWTNTTRYRGANHAGYVEPNPHADGQSISEQKKIFLPAGHYYVAAAADNRGTLKINGQNIFLYKWYDSISRTAVGNNTVIYHPGGTMTVEYQVTGSLRWVHSAIYYTQFVSSQGIAITISEYKQDAYQYEAADKYRYLGNYMQTAYGPPYVGAVMWNTRDGSVGPVGRYQITMPFRASITAYAWGAGGGGGGNDAGTVGGVGSPGLYNTTSFNAERGDLVEVFVGSGGTGGGNSAGSAGGGSPGPSRTSINGDSAKSFNGGGGGRAGGGGSSGGGGGGGGASGVLVNNVPAIVAGGGGGGGGAGNDGNDSSNYSRRDAAITNNATGDYDIGVQALNVDNSGSITLSVQTQLVEYSTLPGMTAPPSAAKSTKVIGFGYGFNASGTFTRTVQTNSKVNLSSSSVLTFFVRKGSLQVPDSGEGLRLEYSTNGSTWTNITTVPVDITADTWLIRSPQIPAGAKIAGGVFLRYSQAVTGSNNVTNKDLWAMTSIFNGSPILDFRGEHAQDKGGDGGGGGGGGGGYPGGQGGATPGGDSSAYAGQCGGNFPGREPLPGEIKALNGVTYSLGGARSGGTGGSGIVILQIEPLSLMSIKVAGEWEQIQEASVKVSGNWKDIVTVYIKINDVWREINGAGQGDINLAGNTQNYGTSLRGFS